MKRTNHHNKLFLTTISLACAGLFSVISACDSSYQAVAESATEDSSKAESASDLENICELNGGVCKNSFTVAATDKRVKAWDAPCTKKAKSSVCVVESKDNACSLAGGLCLLPKSGSFTPDCAAVGEGYTYINLYCANVSRSHGCCLPPQKENDCSKAKGICLLPETGFVPDCSKLGNTYSYSNFYCGNVSRSHGCCTPAVETKTCEAQGFVCEDVMTNSFKCSDGSTPKDAIAFSCTKSEFGKSAGCCPKRGECEVGSVDNCTKLYGTYRCMGGWFCVDSKCVYAKDQTEADAKAGKTNARSCN